jgi:hypothetical protein
MSSPVPFVLVDIAHRYRIVLASKWPQADCSSSLDSLLSYCKPGRTRLMKPVFSDPR